MENQTVGQRIRALRKEKKLTQAQLAKIADVSAPAVTEWEKDGYLPKAAPLKAISDHFGVTTDYILHGEMRPLSQSQTLGTMTQSQAGQSQSQGNNFNDSPELQKLIELLRDKNPSKDVLKHLEQTLELVTKAQENKDQVANGTAPDTKTA